MSQGTFSGTLIWLEAFKRTFVLSPKIDFFQGAGSGVFGQKLASSEVWSFLWSLNFVKIKKHLFLQRYSYPLNRCQFHLDFMSPSLALRDFFMFAPLSVHHCSRQMSFLLRHIGASPSTQNWHPTGFYSRHLLTLSRPGGGILPALTLNLYNLFNFFNTQANTTKLGNYFGNLPGNKSVWWVNDLDIWRCHGNQIFTFFTKF